MHRRLLFALGALVVLGAGLFLAVTLVHPPPRRSATLQARMELAAGTVRVDTGQGAVPVMSGSPLAADAKVTSAPGSRALLRLSDGTGVFLRGGSVLQLVADGTRMESGQLWMDAAASDSRPSVHRLGDVTVSAAGAGMELIRDAREVSVYVARGLATVEAPGGRVEVQAGERATVRGNAAPEVKPVTFWEDWTGGMADHAAAGGLNGAGAGTLYGVDFGGAGGTAASTLEVSRESIRAVIRDGLAETEVDQTFFNPGGRPVEGWYWFSVPAGAHVTGFALDADGQLIEGELIERTEAKRQYEGAAAQGHAPALLEWVDSRTFRARIYPVPAAGSRRAVLRYLQRLPLVEGRMRFVHPLQSREPVRIGEFSLSVDLGEAGRDMELSTLEGARIEDQGRRVTMRRSGFKPLADFQLEARLKQAVVPVRVSRFAAGPDGADYVMARYVPDVDWTRVEVQKAEVVVVVDTSGGGDDAARQLKTATAEAVLRALSADDRFALVALDVKPTVLYPSGGLAAANEKEIAAALERLSDRLPGGATDLSASFDVALSLVHGAEQPAVLYVGDGWATSGELSGDALGERLRRALATSRARFFTVAVGSDANQPLLAELARSGGGATFAVDNTEQATERALQIAAAVKTPTLTGLELDLGSGLDQAFQSANGKVSRGEEVVLLARTHHDLPPRAKVRGRLAGQTFEREYAITYETSVAASLVPRLWAAEAVQRLLGTAADPESVRGKVVAMGMEYGLMTPYTSFIALESEQAFQQRGISRSHSPLQGVRLSSLTAASEGQLLAELAGVTLGGAFGCTRSSSPRSSSPSEAVAVSRVEKLIVTKSTSPENGRALERLAALADAPRPPPAPSGGQVHAALLATGVGAGGGGLATLGLAGMGSTFPSPGGKRGHRVPVRAPEPLVSVPDVSACSTPPKAACSDVARRPLWDRAVIWAHALSQAQSASELVESYRAAVNSCELADWRAESRFLQLLERRVQTPLDAAYVVNQFRCQAESRRFVARLLLRRAVDDAFTSAVEHALFESPVDWAQVDVELAGISDAKRRLEKLRTYVNRAPDEADGMVRLARALARAGRVDEALLQARRLHERGLMTPLLLREVGDLLAATDKTEEAVRTYSEIVEFDPTSRASRRLLGDIYLGHGWYDAAYRQYRTLTELQPADSTAWLRLASSAAGSGRVDEALRLERKVAEAEGTPGLEDPRRWARLWSAARLSRVIQSPPKASEDPARLTEAMRRKLKELQLFQGPGSLVLLTWDDLAVDLALSAPEAAGRGEWVDAAKVGLSGAFLPQGGADGLRAEVRVRGGHRSGPVTVTRHDLSWDGKDFKVKVTQRTLSPSEDALVL